MQSLGWIGRACAIKRQGGSNLYCVNPRSGVVLPAQELWSESFFSRI